MKIRNTTQIWVERRQLYGIFVLVEEETTGGVAKFRLFSQDMRDMKNVIIFSIVSDRHCHAWLLAVYLSLNFFLP